MPSLLAEPQEIATDLFCGGLASDEFSTLELAKLTNTKVSYWENLRWQGRGPSFLRHRRRVRYRRIDVFRWLVKQGQEQGVPRA